MSTKAKPSATLLRSGGTALLCAMTAACVPAPASQPSHAFSALHLGRPAPPPAVDAPSPDEQSARPVAAAGRSAPVLRPPIAALSEPSAVLAVTLEGATDRVAAWLGGAGFAVERHPDGPGELVSATRMGAPVALQADAVCGLEAMHRPDISSTDLTVRLIPAPGGLQVETQARFVEVDTKILSGDLTRQTCRSRGHLEAAVRRAALGG